MRKNKLRSIHYAAALLLYLGLNVAACESQDAEAAEEATEDEAATGAEEAAVVDTVVLATSTFEDAVRLSGVTEAREVSQISAQTSGRITEFELEVGDRVEAGDRVLRVDTSAQSAQVDPIEAQIDQIDDEIDRTQALVDRGLANRRDLDSLNSQRRVLEEQVDSIEAGTRLGRASAPISGTIIETMVHEGEFIGAGQPVARIGDIDTLIVRVQVPEMSLRFVQVGASVEVEIPAYGRTVTATVHEVGFEADETTRTFPVELLIDNEDHALRIGLRTSVMLPRQTLENVVMAPRDAIIAGIDGPRAFVVRDGQAFATDLVLGPGNGDEVVIESGLSAGDQLVVSGQRNLIDGRPVTQTSGPVASNP